MSNNNKQDTVDSSLDLLDQINEILTQEFQLPLNNETTAAIDQTLTPSFTALLSHSNRSQNEFNLIKSQLISGNGHQQHQNVSQFEPATSSRPDRAADRRIKINQRERDRVGKLNEEFERLSKICESCSPKPNIRETKRNLINNAISVIESLEQTAIKLNLEPREMFLKTREGKIKTNNSDDSTTNELK